MQWQIGDVRITQIVEQVAPLPPEGLLANIDPGRLAAHQAWLQPHFMNEAGQILLSIHALVVESMGKTIVVDTCMGNDRPLPMGMEPLETGFLTDLEKVVDRSEVDLVLCTHLHFDHVGWNTMKVGDDWVPTFPGARYLFAQKEYEFWSNAAADANIDFRYSVDPIVEAELADFVDEDHRLTDEVQLVPTPGHTPGHVSVQIKSRGEQAVITGDMVHHPVQLAEPTWSSHPDARPEQATETRRGFVAQYGDAPVLVIGTHFAGPGAGWIRRRGEDIRFETE